MMAPSAPLFPATIAIQNVVVSVAAIVQWFAILIRIIPTAKIPLGIVAFMEFFVVRPKLAQLTRIIVNFEVGDAPSVSRIVFQVSIRLRFCKLRIHENPAYAVSHKIEVCGIWQGKTLDATASKLSDNLADGVLKALSFFPVTAEVFIMRIFRFVNVNFERRLYLRSCLPDLYGLFPARYQFAPPWIDAD